MSKIKSPVKRNGVAASLSNPCFKQKIVKPKKGKRSYKRERLPVLIQALS